MSKESFIKPYDFSISTIKNPTIAWEKWNDPMENMSESPDKDEDDDEDEEYEDKPNMEMKLMKCLSTPMGISSIPEESLLSKNINFWVGNTNFNISAGICNIINQASGVETFDVFTRYKFRVGIGKLFNDGPVISKIDKDVSTYLNNPNPLIMPI